MGASLGAGVPRSVRTGLLDKGADNESENVLSEPVWLPCTTCGETKPVFMYLADGNAPYCRDCGPHRLELEVFPTPIEEVPIVYLGDEDV